MSGFPIKLGGSRQANADILNFLPTCPWMVSWTFWYHQIIRFDDARLTLPAATSYVIDLNTVFANNIFPSNVDLRAGAKVRLIEAFDGAFTDMDLLMGGTFAAGVDADGLLTSTDVFGEDPAYLQTPGAANYAQRYEPNFAPTVTLQATGGNVNTATAGAIEVWIPWSPLKEIG